MFLFARNEDNQEFLRGFQEEGSSRVALLTNYLNARLLFLDDLAALLLAIPGFAPGYAGQTARIADTKNERVYITRTGKKFHRDGCRSLNQSRIPIKRSKLI